MPLLHIIKKKIICNRLLQKKHFGTFRLAGIPFLQIIKNGIFSDRLFFFCSLWKILANSA